MVCPYCGKEAKGTKEHIISNGVLGLFPECFMTIDEGRSKVYLADPMVNDVCAECNNNRITYIDAYAKQIIERYFVKKYEKDTSLQFEYDFSMLQKICLKYAFNDLRSRKKDYSFFDLKVRNYLLDQKDTVPHRNVAILAGLAINTSPAPDYMFGNHKIRWGDTPILCSNSIVENIDYHTGEITIRKDNPRQNLSDLVLSYVFRFNSLQMLLLCFDDGISEEQLTRNCVIVKYQYPYTLLDSSGSSLLSRCTSELTYHHEKLIDVTWGQNLADEISYMRGTFTNTSQESLKAVNKEWQIIERKIAEEHPRN